MRKRFSILLLAGFSFLLLKGDGCHGLPTVTYTMRWAYDCSQWEVPTSFDYGYMTGTTGYQSLGGLPVVSCTGNQIFTVTGKSNRIVAGMVFYVRGAYTNPVQFGPAALTR